MAATAKKLHVVPPDTEGAGKTIGEQLAGAKAARRELEREYKAEARRMDRAISRLERAGKRRKAAAVRELTPARQAGKANVAAARAAIKRLGTATQAAVGQESKVGTGSLTWAIRALLEGGEIEPTGKRVGRSEEYRYVGGRSRVVKPGESS